MDWNHWQAAGRQLLAHWQRSGVTRIPAPLPEQLASADAWLKSHTASLIDTPLESSDPTQAELTKPTSIVREGSQKFSESNGANTLANEIRPPASAGKVAAESNTPTHSRANKESIQAGSGEWTSPTLDLVSRQAAFDTLNQQVVACRKCTDIVCRRKQTVFGVGPLQAKLVMFGEAPGAEEDQVGEPFVGAAGQLLDKILIATGLHRSQVYIMNSLKCRPPGNRTPTDLEIENCRPFFEAQLETIQPDYIICWGAVAAKSVLQTTETVGRLRGRFHRYRGAKVLVTYHPAYLLRNADAKRLTWDDMQILIRELGLTPPPIQKNK